MILHSTASLRNHQTIQPIEQMSKNAFVVSGGGSKGAFAVGVAKYLRDVHPEVGFDIFIGTSTGSLVVPFVAIGELDLIKGIYTSVHTEDIITKGNVLNRFMNHSCIFDVTPLWNVLQMHWTQARFDKLMAMPQAVFVTTVCLQTGGIVYWGNKDMVGNGQFDVRKVTDRLEWLRAVLASACQPVFMPPIEIRSTEAAPRQYCDGGMREYIAMELAIGLGATDVYGVALAPEADVLHNEKYTTAFGILETTIDRFSDDVGLNDVRVPSLINNTLRRLDQVKQRMIADGVPQAAIDAYFLADAHDPFGNKAPINIHVLRPDGPLGGGPGGLTFDPVEMQGMLDKGYARAQQFFMPAPAGDPTIV